MKLFLNIAMVLFSLPALAWEDDLCIASEAERIDAMRSIVAVVNEWVKAEEGHEYFLNKLKSYDESSIPKVLRDQRIWITDSTTERGLPNALQHSCVVEKTKCGYETSKCFVSLVDERTECVVGGVCIGK